MFRGFTKTEHHLILAFAFLLMSGIAIRQYRQEKKFETYIAGNAVELKAGQLNAASVSDDSEPKEYTPAGKIDINTAGEDVLEVLPGIGPSKAAGIVRYREQNGPFANAEALTNVPGIGPKTLQTLLPLIEVHYETAVVPAALPPRVVPAPRAAASPPPPVAALAPALVNLNTATAEQLESLDGIGSALALRILQDRAKNGPFRSVDDLDRVSGIGPKTIAKNRDRLVAR